MLFFIVDFSRIVVGEDERYINAAPVKVVITHTHRQTYRHTYTPSDGSRRACSATVHTVALILSLNRAIMKKLNS